MGKKRGGRAKRHQSYDSDESFGQGQAQEWRGSGRSHEPKKSSKKVVVQAKTQGQKQYIMDVKNHDITFCIGPAGSGKTAIAVGLALEGVMAFNPSYEKIIVLRPAKEACGESIGYLPGTVEEKLSVYLAPVMDNLKVFVDMPAIKNLFYQERIEIIPLAFLRGRSLNGSFIILDEAQNCSKEQMLMILTRIGVGSKLVVTGDLDQNDHPQGGSGLMDAVNRLEGMDGVAVSKLEASDIVRHPMIAEILARYKDDYTPGAPGVEELGEPANRPGRNYDDGTGHDDDDYEDDDEEDYEEDEDGDEMVDYEDEDEEAPGAK